MKFCPARVAGALAHVTALTPDRTSTALPFTTTAGVPGGNTALVLGL